MTLIYHMILNSELGRMWKEAVSVAGVPAKIRTHDILNRSRKLYRVVQFAQWERK
jgi:hypothetical protein